MIEEAYYCKIEQSTDLKKMEIVKKTNQIMTRSIDIR